MKLVFGLAPRNRELSPSESKAPENLGSVGQNLDPGAYTPRDKRSMVKVDYFLTFEVANLDSFFTCKLRVRKSFLPYHVWTVKYHASSSIIGSVFSVLEDLFLIFVTPYFSHNTSREIYANARRIDVLSSRHNTTLIRSFL